MKIRYSKERLKGNLRSGLYFFSIGLILILLSFIKAEFRGISIIVLGVSQISAGFFLFIIHYFENRRQYLTIKKDELIKNSLIPRRIKFTEIKSIREFAGDLKLIMKKGEFIIDTHIVDPNSLVELKKELEKYNLS